MDSWSWTLRHSDNLINVPAIPTETVWHSDRTQSRPEADLDSTIQTLGLDVLGWWRVPPYCGPASVRLLNCKSENNAPSESMFTKLLSD